MLRKLLLTLLCLALTLPAWSQPGPSSSADCPMAAEMAAMAASGEWPADALLADCCNTLEVYLQSGETCQRGQDCGAAGPLVALPLRSALAAASAVALSIPDVAVAAPPGAPRAAIWRPPQP